MPFPIEEPQFIKMRAKSVTFTLFIWAFVQFFASVYSCDGYELHVDRLENCGSRNILVLKKFNVSLGRDCKITPSGCAENTKKMTNAKIHYRIVKSMVPLIGTKDTCETLGGASADAVTILNFLALPTSCPINPSKICGASKKPVDIYKFRRTFPLLLGDIKANITITSDAGNSCILFEGSFKKSGALGKLPGIGR